MDTDTINKAYANLVTANSAYFEEATLATTLRADLEQMRSTKTLTGEITGKNPDERTASARTILSEHYIRLERIEYREKLSKHALELAQIEVERVRMLMRLEEVQRPVVIGSGMPEITKL